MKKMSIVASLLILTMALLGSGCDLFGGSSDAVAVPTGPANVPLKFIVKDDTVVGQRIGAAPARQINAQIAQPATLTLEYYNAETGAQIIPTEQKVDTNAQDAKDKDITVTGPFLGVTLFVKVIRTADTTKEEAVVFGKIPATVADVTVAITNLPEISITTIVATKIFLQENTATVTGTKLEEKISSLKTVITFNATATTAEATAAANNVIKVKAEIVTQQVADNVFTDGVTTINTVDDLLDALDGTTTTPPVTITNVTTTVTTAEAAGMTVTSVTPVSVAYKNVSTTDLIIAGTNFGTDKTKLTVKIGAETAVIKDVNATGTAVTVNLTDAQAQTLFGTGLFTGTSLNLAITVDKAVTVKDAANADVVSKVSVTTTDVKLTITPAEKPTVTSITPASVAIKSIAATDLVIAGTNFGTDKTKLTVKIGAETATIKTATDTAVTVNLTAAQAETLIGAANLYGGTAFSGVISIDKAVSINNAASSVNVTTTDVKLTITPAAISSIVTTPANGSTIQIVKGSKQLVTVTAKYDYGTDQNVTATATYAALAGKGTFSTTTKGEYTAPDAEGSDTITVSFGGQTSTIMVTVINSPLNSIFVSTVNNSATAANTTSANVKQGFTQQLYIWGIHDDTQTRSVASSAVSFTLNPTTAGTVDASGLLTVSSGSNFTVVAVHNLDAATTSVAFNITVEALNSIQLTAKNGATDFTTGGTIKMNETLTLTATGTYTAAGVALPDVVYTATNGTVANGVFTPTAPGAATVYASFAGVDSTTINVTVSTDPVISNVVFQRTGPTTATLTWTTAYDIAGARIRIGMIGMLSPPLDFSAQLKTDTSSASKTHTFAITGINSTANQTDDMWELDPVAPDPTDTSAAGKYLNDGWRITVGYQLEKLYNSDNILLKE